MTLDATPIKTTKRELTIGMATYDDYDGVYFTLQALRLYHENALDDTEILVIDNNPTGPCAESLKALENSYKHYRYIPALDKKSTSIRELIVDNGFGKFILIMDCHVMLYPDALHKLRNYMRENPNTNDILQGPLVHDDLSYISTHFKPKWSSGMYGTWDIDEKGKNVDDPPFEIPMQGLGVFAFRKEAWPGFNPSFRGFGGEEFYIHEKFRLNGGKAICLPFLRWIHRFKRPMGIPYENRWEDRIRNYMIGWTELNLPTDDLKKHFTELLGEKTVKPIFNRIKSELKI